MQSSFIRRAAIAIALVGTGAAAGAIPSIASARGGKPLSKAQVIALIKRYSKPGPPGRNGSNGSNGRNGGQGPTGPTGPSGPAGPGWMLGTNSGLTLAGNVLTINASILTNCHGDEFVSSIFSSGLVCSYPAINFQTGGIDTSTNPGPQTTIALTSSLATIATTSTTELGPASYLILANVRFDNFGTVDTDQCALVDTTDGTDFTSEATTDPTNGWANMTIMAAPMLQVGQDIAVQCSSNGTDKAGATIFLTPVHNFA